MRRIDLTAAVRTARSVSDGHFSDAVFAPRGLLVTRILGDVDVDAGVKLLRELSQRVQRFVFQRERRMRPDQPGESPGAMRLAHLAQDLLGDVRQDRVIGLERRQAPRC